jgi:hypothetical protein
MTSRFLFLSVFVALVALAACSSNALSPPAFGHINQTSMHGGYAQPETGPTCPPGNNPPSWPDPQNIITDGAFHPTSEPYTFYEYTGVIPGIQWSQSVPGRTIDLVGLHEWGAPSPGNECTVDLDGSNHGGISESFATVPTQVYHVYFQLSGSIDDQPPPLHINKLRLSAAGQSEVFTWDTTSSPGHDVFHGVYGRRHWKFTANDTSTTLEFRSMDPPQDQKSGAVITEIVVK